jgi:hypothetical protein
MPIDKTKSKWNLSFPLPNIKSNFEYSFDKDDP